MESEEMSIPMGYNPNHYQNQQGAIEALADQIRNEVKAEFEAKVLNLEAELEKLKEYKVHYELEYQLRNGAKISR